MAAFSGKRKTYRTGTGLRPGSGNRRRKRSPETGSSSEESMAEEEVESISWIQAQRMEREELETPPGKLEAFSE